MAKASTSYASPSCGASAFPPPFTGSVAAAYRRDREAVEGAQCQQSERLRPLRLTSFGTSPVNGGGKEPAASVPPIRPLSTAQGEGGSSHSSKRILGKLLESFKYGHARDGKSHPAANPLSTSYARSTLPLREGRIAPAIRGGVMLRHLRHDPSPKSWLASLAKISTRQGALGCAPVLRTPQGEGE